MHYYQHHISDFNQATRHLTRVERALYRDLIELYYDTEKPLISDFDRLSRRVLAVNQEEKEALQYVLEEFFTLTDDGYRQSRCDAELEKYHNTNVAKSKAGKASAEARRQQKAQQEAAEVEQDLTDVEQVLNTCATNQEPLTTNHKPITNITPLTPPRGKYKFAGDDFSFAQRMLDSIRIVQPDFKQPNLEKWASVIRLMREQDNRDYSGMAEIWQFARGDPFWQTNILSASKFREKFDQLKAKKLSQGAQHAAYQPIDNSAVGRIRAENARREAERNRQSERQVN